VINLGVLYAADLLYFQQSDDQLINRQL